jgi:nitrogen regulatory protein PII
MKMLIIVARESMLGELEELLRENGIMGYTILNHVLGKGVTGKMVGTFFQPDINSIIFAVLPSNQADRAVSALTAFHTARGLATQGQPVPIKVFTFPCEEHV